MKTKHKAPGRYLKIGDVLFQSIAFRTLPGSAMKLWIDVRTQYNGNNNGRLLLTPKVLRHRGWNSRSTLHAAAQELMRRGLLRFTRRCGPNVFHKAHMVAFTDVAVSRSDEYGIAGAEPTEEFLRWLPGLSFDPRDNDADVPANAAFCDDRNPVTNGTGIRSDTGPESGQRTPETGPESGQRRNARKPAPVLDLRAIRVGSRALS